MPIAFRPIARLLARTLRTAAHVDSSALAPYLAEMGREGEGISALITVNHYYAADFRAWWFVILISTSFPREIHWVVAREWTNSGWLTGLTHWLFPKSAMLVGFTPMPAMPPNPSEVEQRAEAVRQVLDYARNTPFPVIGMAPEGRDSAGGALGDLPPGVGRFLELLSQHCPDVLPVGVWMEAGVINIRFGSPYRLERAKGLAADERDKWVGDIVMRHIAELLPERLRGKYG